MIPVLFLVTLVSFVLLRLSPGDPVTVYAGMEQDPEYIQRVRAEYGLDQPLPVQYVLWLGHALRGDLGTSIPKGRPVVELIGDAIPRSLELGIIALIVHSTIALAVGVLCAVFRDSWLDIAAASFTFAVISIPGFVLAFVLILLFTITWRIFPPGGYVPFTTDPVQHLRTLVLPVTALGLGSLATVMRQTRSSLLEVLDDDYIRTARAKGVAERWVLIRHALRNALIPVTTIVGLQLGAVVEGAFIVETIFAWPGVGRLAVESIAMRDYAVVQGTVLVAAVSFTLSTLLTDVAYAKLDPRISYGGGRG